MIEFKNVNKTYLDSIVALKGVNLDIDAKEFTFITGPSGAGKSTLLRLLIREERPTLGEIFFEEVDVVNLSHKLLPVYRQQIGVAFQDLKLVDSRTARENIEFALEIINKSQKEIDSATEYLLELVKLKDRADLLPCQLSGGEKQKIAIARALANEPKVLIADEPTGNLDSKSTQEIIDILKTINSLGTTVLIITHNDDIVKKMNERVIVLEKGEIVEDKKPKKKAKVSEKEEEEKEEEANEIKDLKLPKEIEQKLLKNDITTLDKLLDLTEKKLKTMGIKKDDLETITQAIMELDNLEEK